MRGLDTAKTFWTDKDMPAEELGSAGEHFKHIDNNSDANQLAMGKKETPPIAVVEKDISEFDMTADEFHKGTIVNLNAGER